MNNVVTSYGDDAVTSKEELIDRLTKRLADAEGKAAYIANKLTRQPVQYLGDPYAELDQAKASARVYREQLEKLQGELK